MRAALKGMKPGKATFDLLKVVGDPVPKELKRNFNGIHHEALCLEEWTTSLAHLLYKEKGIHLVVATIEDSDS